MLESAGVMSAESARVGRMADALAGGWPRTFGQPEQRAFALTVARTCLTALTQRPAPRAGEEEPTIYREAWSINIAVREGETVTTAIERCAKRLAETLGRYTYAPAIPDDEVTRPPVVPEES